MDWLKIESDRHPFDSRNQCFDRHVSSGVQTLDVGLR